MTPTPEPTVPAPMRQAEFRDLLHEKLRSAIWLTLATILDEEVTLFIGAPRYGRTPTRRDQRNGHYARDLVTTAGLVERVPVPRARGGFRTQVFARNARRQAELDTAISEMFVFGTSTMRVGQVVETLTATHPSPSTVSRVFHTLDDEFTAWKTRPLAAHYVYVFADGTYFTVIYDGEGQNMPVLAVMGINAAGEREVLAFTVGERENQGAWEDLLEQIKTRGVQQVDLWITDGNQAMLNAVERKFPTSARQRCDKHKMENVLSDVPDKQRNAVEPELKTIFYQETRAQADQIVAAFCAKYVKTYPTAVECLQRDLDACLTCYAFPKAHWKTIRTTNVIERLYNEVKRRSHKMAAAFRNEGSCLLTRTCGVGRCVLCRRPLAQLPPHQHADTVSRPALFYKTCSTNTGAAILHCGAVRLNHAPSREWRLARLNDC
jgi:putative transposase